MRKAADPDPPHPGATPALLPAPRDRFFAVLPFVALIGGSLLALGCGWFVARLEDQAIRARFELEAKQRGLAFRQHLDRAEAGLRSVLLLFEASNQPVTRAGFSKFLTPLLQRHPEIQAIGYDPLVRAEDRAEHERKARQEGLTGYRITERKRQGEMVPALDRPVYFPVFYMEPSTGNEAAFGFDIGSEPKRSQAISRARKTGELAVTAPLTLVQGELGFLAMVPRFRSPTDSSKPSLLGLIVGVYRLKTLAEASLSAFEPGLMTLQAFDATDPQAHQKLLELGTDPAAGIEIPYQLTFGGRSFRLLFRPTNTFRDSLRGYYPHITLAAGLLLSILTALALSALTRRTQQIQQLLHAEQRQREELQRAESSLRTSEERLSLMLNAVSDGGWDWDLTNDHVAFSEAWLRSLGYAKGEIKGHISSWEELLHPDDVERVLAERQAHLAGRTLVYECENRLRTKAGTYRHNLGRGKVVLRDEHGAPLRMVGTDTDMTRRKAEEAERERLLQKVLKRQKLESLGVLVGGVAHDFNNLLTGIMGSAELALWATNKPALLEEHLRRILKTGSRAAELIGEMLAYAGRGTFTLEDVNLSKLVDELPQLLSASVSKRATVDRRIEPDVWVHGDAAQLRQVVMNLLINASDALEDEAGTITIQVGHAELDQADLERDVLGEGLSPGRYAYLEVRDTGPGMTPEVRERVFDPFFTTKSAGRGLGLAAVQGIVRWHKGLLTLESTPGQGTAFRVLIPALASPPELAPLPAAAPPPPASLAGTVLVVDDEPEVRRIMSLTLERLGFTVLQAEDGQAGLAVFEEHAEQIRLVLLDMTMPHMTGIEAATAIRRLRPDVPIVIASGYAVPKDLSTIPNARFVAKPFTVEALTEAVCLALE